MILLVKVSAIVHEQLWRVTVLIKYSMFYCCIQSDDKPDDESPAVPPTNTDAASPLQDVSFISSTTQNAVPTPKTWQTHVHFCVFLVLGQLAELIV